VPEVSVIRVVLTFSGDIRCKVPKGGIEALSIVMFNDNR